MERSHLIWLAAGAVALPFALAGTARADEFKLRIASGHPPANTYVNLMQNFFVPEVTKRVAARTKHKVEFIEGYGGSIVKVADTLEGVQSGIIDVGGYCFCFEPSNLPLHAFQVMLPFGPVDSIDSLRVAQDVYAKVPYLTSVFEEKFSQKLLARITLAGAVYLALIALLPTWRWVRTPADRRLDRALAELRGWLDGLIRATRSRLEAEPELAERPANLWFFVSNLIRTGG